MNAATEACAVLLYLKSRAEQLRSATTKKGEDTEDNSTLICDTVEGIADRFLLRTAGFRDAAEMVHFLDHSLWVLDAVGRQGYAPSAFDAEDLQRFSRFMAERFPGEKPE